MEMGIVLSECVTDVLRHIMRIKMLMLFSYIDDVISVHKHESDIAEFNLLHFLFEWHTSQPPKSCATYQGPNMLGRHCGHQRKSACYTTE